MMRLDGASWCAEVDMMVPDAFLVITAVHVMTATDVPGSATMRKQLTHILFVQVLRTLLALRGIAPGWLGVLSDRQVGAALTLLHEQPARRWTVADLAAAVSMSR